MTPTIEPLAVPLRPYADGVLCVGGTRVTLDTVVEAFREGATPEEIAQQYPTLALADVYAVIGYALRFPEAVEDYLGRRRAEVRRRNEARFDPAGIRDRPLRRDRKG